MDNKINENIEVNDLGRVIGEITVKDFMNTKYRDYWEYSNKDGKNSITPKEQLPEVVRKIIYASYKLNIKPGEERKTPELAGETNKYHAHSNTGIEDSVKGVATAYKSQKAIRFLEGVGNFGVAQGDSGSAGRYTSVSGTPLLSAIYEDIPFMPMDTDDTGLLQPTYISCPLPIALISGVSPIGTGKSCYIAEREAGEVIDWIDKLRNNDWEEVNKETGEVINIPEPMSVTGCTTWFNKDNGYVYYDANIHFAKDINDLNKKGKFDVITELPPNATPDNVIYKLQQKLPTRTSKNIRNGAGKGRPIYIIVPTGYIEEKDYRKLGLRNSRKEQIFVWDEDKHTMRYETSIIPIAKEWFEDRCNVVKRRLSRQVRNLEANNHAIDLIKLFVENNMFDWKSEEVVDFFVKLAVENKFTGYELDQDKNPIEVTYEEAGQIDANTVLSQRARAFLPESLEKDQLTREKNDKQIKELNKKIKNIGTTVIDEAKAIIKAQNEFNWSSEE